MNTPIEKYFNAEKSESILFVLVGIMVIGLAIYFILKLKQPFYMGMAYPFILVALIQIVVGNTVYFRSPKDIIRMNEIIKKAPIEIQTVEIPRMNVVMKNFEIYRWVEIGLIVVGLGLFFMFPGDSIWKGVGLGLAIQAGFMLGLDFFAESRGREYLAYLQNI